MSRKARVFCRQSSGKHRKSGRPNRAVRERIRTIRARALARAVKLNVECFSANFIVRDALIWYADYGCGDHADEWSFGTRGIRYRSRGPALLSYREEKRKKDRLHACL